MVDTLVADPDAAAAPTLPLATRTAASSTRPFLLVLTACFLNGAFPLFVVLFGRSLLDDEDKTS